MVSKVHSKMVPDLDVLLIPNDADTTTALLNDEEWTVLLVVLSVFVEPKLRKKLLRIKVCILFIQFLNTSSYRPYPGTRRRSSH